jgi:hypothetical protein
VFLHERACPFCGATWLLSAVAAASLLLGAPADAAPPPVPDAAMHWSEPEYGVERPPVDLIEPSIVWAKTMDWKVDYGLSPVAKSWGEARPGASVTYIVRVTGKGETPVRGGITHTLVKAGDDALEFTVMGTAREPSPAKLARRAEIPAEAKAVSWGTETLEIAGKKLECAWRTLEVPGREFRVWTAKDLGVVRVECGDEASQYAGTEEIAIAWQRRTCAVWTTSFGSTEIREWRSAEVPGLVARWEETVRDAGNPKGEALRVTTIDVSTIQPGR